METLKSLIEIIEFQQANDISRLKMSLCDYATVKRRISNRDHRATLAKVYFLIFDKLIFFATNAIGVRAFEKFPRLWEIDKLFWDSFQGSFC